MLQSIINGIKKTNIEIYIAIISLLSLLGWIISYNAFVTLALILVFILIYVKKNPLYFILGLITIIFSYNTKYSFDFPIEVAIFSTLLLIYLMYIIYKNIKKATIDPTMIFLIVASILSFVTIIWNNSILLEHPMLFIIIFAWPLYLLLYIAFKVIMKKDSIHYVLLILKYLGLLLSLEVLYSAFTGQNSNFLMCDYNLGWGVCNEAGILLCFLAPIVAYLFIKTKNSYLKLFNLFILFLMAFAIIATGSRGSYLFGGIEAIAIFIIILIYSRRRLLISSIVITGLVTAVTIIFITTGLQFKDFIANAFYNGFDDSGRFTLWRLGLSIWDNNFLTNVFGSGMVSYFSKGELPFYEPNVYIVYHSSFIQILVTFGTLGLFLGFIHQVHKYFMLLNIDKCLALFIFVGYITVEVYGLIDNTYGMYYFMPLLFILMVSIEKNGKDKSLILF